MKQLITTGEGPEREAYTSIPRRRIDNGDSANVSRETFEKASQTDQIWQKCVDVSADSLYVRLKTAMFHVKQSTAAKKNEAIAQRVRIPFSPCARWRFLGVSRETM